MRSLVYAMVFSLAFLMAGSALAQERADDVRTPATVRRDVDFVLEKIGLEVVIDGQMARCTVKYVLYNPGSGPLEMDFLAPLPEGGTITGVTLLDGQKEMAGEVYTKDEAQEIYNKIVAQLRDPALLEYAGRDTFRARVFPVPAKGRQTLELKFDYLLPKRDGEVGFVFPLAGPMTRGQKPEQEVHAVIRNGAELSNIYSPLSGVTIDKKAGLDAVAAFAAKKEKVIERFSLYYQAAPSQSAVEAMVLSHKPDRDEDGFFLLLAEPALRADAEPELAKNVVFVLDQSGSMNGQKFKQACGALKFVLERLNERDNFNLVHYNSDVSSWRPELAAMTPENRKAALAYVDNLRSQGNTNIEEALEVSLSMLTDPDAPNYVIFLTDGQPTVGEKNEMKLARTAELANPEGGVRLFAFGVGFDVNARLLDRLSGQAGGSSVFVKPDENLESAVASFFSRLTSPALTRPTLASSRPVNRVMPKPVPDLFLGQQLVLAGRYPKGGAATFTLTGRRGDREESFTYEVNLADGAAPNGAFISQVWAQRRIGELIDEIDLAGGAPSKELVDELVELSKTYGILTPYTSFLALEDQALSDPALADMANQNLSRLQETVGSDANAQRAMKFEMKSAAAAPPTAPRMEADMVQMDMEVAKRGADKFRPPRQMNGVTFYFKDNQWQSSDVTEKDIKNARRVAQLSDEYFELAKKLNADEMVWLSQEEAVMFNYKGTTWLIEPAA